MILVTRLNGQQFVINAEKIRHVEATPDTVICCDHGERYIVKENLTEVVRRAIEWSRMSKRPLAA
jgi:flagellar protein FlbD